MNKIFLFILLGITPLIKTYSQEEYAISLESRNDAIKLTTEAIDAIEEENLDLAFSLLIESFYLDSTYFDTYRRLYQVCMYDPDKCKDTRKVYASGKRIFQENDELLFFSGEILRLDSCYDLAIEEYTLAMNFARINGEDYYLVPYYYLNRGNVFLQKKQYNKALSDYSYLLHLDSLSLSGLTNRGITLYQLKRTEEACRDWKKAKISGNKAAKYYFLKYCDGIIPLE